MVVVYGGDKPSLSLGKEVKMEKFVKVAEIRPINSETSKVITEALENAGFVVCFDSYHSENPTDLIVMKKATK